MKIKEFFNLIFKLCFLLIWVFWLLKFIVVDDFNSIIAGLAIIPLGLVSWILAFFIIATNKKERPK